MSDYKTEVLIDGLGFGEGPRWHDGELWFSDFHDCNVHAVALDGRRRVVAHVPQQPSGIGFRPDGSVLVVSMRDKKLVRIDRGEVEEVADLSGVATGLCNDMVVDGAGRAYVGNFGYDLFGGGSPVPAKLALVTPDNEVRVAAEDFSFPNGSVVTPDGRTLIVAETFGARLSAFDIADDGSLSNRRVFADLGDLGPDGICLDAEGAVWAACPQGEQFVRVHEGGRISHRIETPGRWAVACALGGPGRTTFFGLTAETTLEQLAQGISKGAVEVATVDVAGAGFP